MKKVDREYITADQLIDRKIVNDKFLTHKLSTKSLKELYDICKENKVSIISCDKVSGLIKKKYKIHIKGYDGAIAYLKVLYEDGRN